MTDALDPALRRWLPAGLAPASAHPWQPQLRAWGPDGVETTVARQVRGAHGSGVRIGCRSSVTCPALRPSRRPRRKGGVERVEQAALIPHSSWSPAIVRVPGCFTALLRALGVDGACGYCEDSLLGPQQPHKGLFHGCMHKRCGHVTPFSWQVVCLNTAGTPHGKAGLICRTSGAPARSVALPPDAPMALASKACSLRHAWNSWQLHLELLSPSVPTACAPRRLAHKVLC